MIKGDLKWGVCNRLITYENLITKVTLKSVTMALHVCSGGNGLTLLLNLKGLLIGYHNLCFPTLYTVCFPPFFLSHVGCPTEAYGLQLIQEAPKCGMLAEEIRTRSSVESRLWSEHYNHAHRRMKNQVTECFIPNIIKDTRKIKTESICWCFWTEKIHNLRQVLKISETLRMLLHLACLDLFIVSNLVWSKSC